ncbi:glycosyltransferase family 2 protein [Flavobacterium facile]|uniref:glycosyltransferase family 2 protein n=1 Tax=Flavobacterium facile TaxID=2893174 RepID=UPI002E760F71|nr:glycosyltransferase family 2 protein [Flavobacterium sp. T-12]
MQFSFIVPIYNDGYLVQSFCEEFKKTFQNYIEKEEIENDVELIFVNDGSKDNSIHLLIENSKTFKFVKVIDLSRNFGQHIALSCGYEKATGNFVGMLNVDQQEPPSQLPILIDYLIKNNFDIVFGTFEERKTSFLNKTTSKLFSIILNYLTQNNTPSNVTTSRVMNRKFVNAYNQLTEKSRYLPGLETWLGFKHGFTPIIHTERKIGKSSYNFKKRILMALDTIVSFSDFPLKLIVGIGIFVALIGFGLTFFLLISKTFITDYQPGYTSTVSLITFLGGIQIMVIGFASIYIGRILKEVQNRPLYIINETYNFK